MLSEEVRENHEEMVNLAYTTYSMLKSVLPSRSVWFAGGFPRDLLLGREIKDIDVYLDVRNIPVRKLSYAGQHLQSIGFTVLGDEEYRGEEDEGLVHTVLESEDKKVNIILLNYRAPQYVREKFDLGLCQVMIGEDEGTIYMTDSFVHDVYHQVISVHTEVGEHLARVMNKYPTFSTQRPSSTPGSWVLRSQVAECIIKCGEYHE